MVEKVLYGMAPCQSLYKTEELVKEHPGIDTKPILLFFIMAIVWYFLYFVRNGFWRSRA